MSCIVLFSASYCHGDEVARSVAQALDYELLTHEQLLSDAARQSDLDAAQLERAMWGQRSVFNRLTREKERGLACLRAHVAQRVAGDRVVLLTPAGHLIPRTLTQVLRVCLVADHEYRLKVAAQEAQLSSRAAQKLLRQSDGQWKNLTLQLFGLAPWDRRLIDILLPMHSTTPQQATEVICENARKPAVATTERAREAAQDFVLAARVQEALADRGHDIDVHADNGCVTIVINRYVAQLDKVRHQLSKIAGGVEGVREVQSKVGPHYKQPDIYPGLDDEDLPPKILLVDDEKEFVLTLSERLEARNLGSAVAHDGEEALAIVESDAPDVMVLDLKMPGIDGLEVLRRVKRERPETEVIILTGHGSDREETRARELGAFAYLNKPVDIDVLTETMKRAYERVRGRQQEEGPDADGSG